MIFTILVVAIGCFGCGGYVGYLIGREEGWHSCRIYERTQRVQ